MRKPKKGTAPAPEPEPVGAVLLEQLTAAVNQAAEDEGMGPVATDGEEAGASEAEPRTQRELEAEAAAAKAKPKAKRARAKKGNKKGGEEVNEDGEAAEPVAKKARTTSGKGKAAGKAKGKGKGKAAASNEEGEGLEDEDGDEENQVARPKKRAAQKRATRRSAVVEDLDAPMQDSDEDEAAAEPETDADANSSAGSEVDEYDKLKPKKRRVRKKSTKPLFQPDSEEETEEQTQARKAEEQAALALLPAEDVLSEYQTDGSESGSDGERRPVKVRTLRKKTYLEKIRIHVDPVQTTMFELATARDAVWGRESSRGRQMTKLVIDKKEQRRIARVKMRQRTLKEHAKRQARARGEDVPDTDGDEADGGERDEDGTLSGSRAGSPAVLSNTQRNADNADEVDATEAKADGEEDEEDDDVGELTETFYVPQMRMVDGQMVIDDASLEVDRAADPNMQMTGPREVIEETGRERMVNSATWSRHTIKTDKWTTEETEEFYDVSPSFDRNWMQHVVDGD